MKTFKASQIRVDKRLKPLTDLLQKQYLAEESMVSELDDDDYHIPDDLLACVKERPRTIEDLTDGMSFDAYEFTRGSEAKLKLLGFFNVNFDQHKKVVVAEFAQTGTQFCQNRPLVYGIGARMLLKINKTSWGAKLDSPQQIAASVLFNKASVQYTIKTFGITGPGVSSLIGQGTLNENSFHNFVKDISSLIIEIYKKNSKFIITPQPLFLKPQA